MADQEKGGSKEEELERKQEPELVDEQLDEVAGGASTVRKIPGRLKWADVSLKGGEVGLTNDKATES